MGKTIGFWVISASVLTDLHRQRKGKALGSMKTERNQIVTYDSRGNENAKCGGKRLLVKRAYCAYL